MSIISAGTSNTTSLIYTGDTTGNLAFQTNGTTEAMRINASQNVGIGATSPLARLHIEGNSSSAVQAFIENANGATNSSAELVFGTWSGAIPTGTGNPGPSAKISAINGNVNDARTDLVFSTYNGGTSAERMRIDSSGRVTTPFQPAFRVFHNNTLAWNSGALSPIVYNTAVFNVGNHYNTSTGVFTAPIAGVYSFTVYEMFMDEPSYTFIYLAVQINGVTTSEFMRQGTKSNYDTFGGTVLVSLSANDQVRIVCGLNGVDAGYLRLGVDMNSFMGYLLG